MKHELHLTAEGSRAGGVGAVGTLTVRLSKRFVFTRTYYRGGHCKDKAKKQNKKKVLPQKEFGLTYLCCIVVCI